MRLASLRGNLAGNKGLADMVSNHIVLAPRPAGERGILPLGEQELRVSHTAVTLPAGNEPAVVCFCGFFT